jgi:hypothetical protein
MRRAKSALFENHKECGTPSTCEKGRPPARFVSNRGKNGDNLWGSVWVLKMADNPIVKIDVLGELSKPATVLIEKISSAVGTVFQPYQVVRLAKAEAEAERIRSEGRIEATDIERRAAYRWLKEEAKRQANIETIASRALPLLHDTSAPEAIEDDWITHFFDKGRLISDEEMQRLWSAVLAGEANEPGSVSKRTVNVLADLDKFDAELFTRLCGFGWKMEGYELAELKGRSPKEKRLLVVPVVLGSSYGANSLSERYTSRGINYAALTHLNSLGLITFNERGLWWTGIPKKTAVFYFGNAVELEIPHPNYPSLTKGPKYGLDIGHAILTRAGYELAPICRAEPVEGFFEYVRDYWKQLGLLSAESGSGQVTPSSPEQSEKKK